MRRVLVIDDHQPSRRHLVNILNSGGYEIAGEASTGKVAVALARSAVADVILMAVGLPDIDGHRDRRGGDAHLSVAHHLAHRPLRHSDHRAR